MRRRADEGSVAVEAAILAPTLLAFVLIAVAAGRIQTTVGEVDAAARAGARAASLARTPEGARTAAADAVQDSLRGRGVDCTEEPTQDPVYGTIDTPTGPLDTVSVTVRCTVRLDDLLLAGMPGGKTMTGRFTSVIDRYRGN